MSLQNFRHVKLYPFQNLSHRLIIFFNFNKFQPRCSYKILYNYPPKGIKRCSPALRGSSCFSIHKISWIKVKKSNFKSFSRNFVYNLQAFRGYCQKRIVRLISKAHYLATCTAPSFSKLKRSLTYIALILFLLLYLCIPITRIFCLVAFVTSF